MESLRSFDPWQQRSREAVKAVELTAARETPRDQASAFLTDHLPGDTIRIAIPLTIQTFLIFFITYFASKALRLPFEIAAPAGMIGASNFFELSVAVAIALFGTEAGLAFAPCSTNSAFVAPQSGQTQLSGRSSQRVPGAMPASGMVSSSFKF